MSSTNPITPGRTPAQAKGWLARNWKLVLGLVVGVSALVIVAVFGLLFAIMSLLKGSEAAKQALARARSNPAVLEHLGTPIEAGWWGSGSINLSGDFGDAKLILPIFGPKGKGKLYLMAEKRAGTWFFNLLQVVIEGSGEKIDLLASPSIVRMPAPLRALSIA